MDDRKFRRIAEIAERTYFFGSVIFMNLFLGLIFPGIYFLDIPKNAWAEPPCHVHVRVHPLGFEASPPRVPDRDGIFVSDRKNSRGYTYAVLTLWVVMNVDYMSVADFETKLKQNMLKVGLDIDHCTPVKSRKKTSTLDAYAATLCQVIKDQKWAYASYLVQKSFYRLSATAVCEYAGVHIEPDNTERQPYL